MGGVQRQDDLIGQLADIQRRLRALETAPRLPNSEVGGVSLTALTSIGGLEEIGDSTLIGPANALNSVTTYQNFDTYDVTVGPTGQLLIVLRAHMDLTSTPGGSGRMAFRLTGANTRSPVDTDSALIDSVDSLQVTLHLVRLMTGLNPGLTTVTNCFRTGSANILQFEDRYTFAIPF